MHLLHKALPAPYVCALLLVLAGCATETPPSADRQRLTPVSFGDLPGWNTDAVGEALPALAKSCATYLKKTPDAKLGIAGRASDWQPACGALLQAPPADETAARAFLTRWFHPYQLAGKDGSDGLFTGYYEAELQGSLTPAAGFAVPLYTRPNDLISVDLSLFRPEWKGHNIVGKVDGRKFIPYDDRATIVTGSLASRAQPLLWVDDKVTAFFLEIQGSGRVHLTDGTTVRIGYDGSNGRAFVPIGRTLADANEIARPVTLPAVRNWLQTHPDRAQQVMNENRSYVFFRRVDTASNDTNGPIGAEGLSLTPGRSLAVDPAFVPLGVPVWLDTKDGFGRPLQRLMVAQDTGGAIKGAVRGDYFWGYGKQAETEAGAMQSRGSEYILLPQSVSPLFSQADAN